MVKFRVGILCGGQSAEHEVSLMSARNVAEAIDKDKYEVVVIGIAKNGQWLMPRNAHFLSETGTDTGELTASTATAVSLIPQCRGEIRDGSGNSAGKIDVVFPVLHGPFGEDGTVQGLLKLADVPFVGASVLGSAVGMDKDVMKRLLRDAGLPIGKFMVLKIGEPVDFKNIEKELGHPMFVKPANMGSSVGVSKVRSAEDFKTAIETAFTYDTKILVEEFIEGREIECGVLGNDDPKASEVGEIIPHHEFYDYDAKYLDENGAGLEVPAKISPEVRARVQELSLQAFKTLCCEGLARVDFFLKKDGTLYVNEINTIPGFTKISMYPRLWAASGISYPQLIDSLLQLAIERFEREKKLKTYK